MVNLRINGQEHELDVPDNMPLLWALRDVVGMKGTKFGCGIAQCGACTVLLDGKRINACLTLAASVDGTDVTTIEGLAQGDTLHPVQAAFIEHDGFQCGYCTPGQIMSAVGLLSEGDAGADPERIREGMSGNICRCAAYPGITAAVLDAERRQSESEGPSV